MPSRSIPPEADTAQADRVVVTGGSGFVGRSVVRAFLKRGTPVTIVDLQAPPADLDDPRVTFVEGDLREAATRERAISQATAGVIHLAAITSVLKSVEKPAETYTNNVEVTHELLELCRQRGVGQFILASTNAVVGDIGHGTINEELPVRPLTPYGATKAACEMLLAGYAGSYGLATTALRFTNIYGPGMNQKDSFIPRLMRAALSGTGVEVYGDGSQCRDFVHIDDVVQGIVAAWDKEYSGTAVIGSGRSITVLELIDAVKAATEIDIPVTHVPAKNGEMPAVIVEVAKAERELGYQPAVELTDGLRTVWSDFGGAR